VKLVNTAEKMVNTRAMLDYMTDSSVSKSARSANSVVTSVNIPGKWDYMKDSLESTMVMLDYNAAKRALPIAPVTLASMKEKLVNNSVTWVNSSVKWGCMMDSLVSNLATLDCRKGSSVNSLAMPDSDYTSDWYNWANTSDSTADNADSLDWS
jgi:hypothetical protein